MHAVVLAGGKGVRLRPYTTSLPKPLVPIGDEFSILEIVLMQLADRGFTDVTIAIGHLGHLIKSFVGGGARWGLRVDYLEEQTPLGTMGPVLHLADRLPEHVLVMNGDILTDLRYDDLLRRHADGSAALTIATYTRDVYVDFGVLDVTDTRVVGFREKPRQHFDVSMGVYAVTTSALRRYPKDQHFGFDDLVLDLLERDEPPASLAFDGFWLDIGRPDDYDRANAEFGTLRQVLLPGRPVRKAAVPA